MNPFQQAKEAIQAKGHIKEDFATDDGYCVMGAYNVVVEYNDEFRDDRTKKRVRDLRILGDICKEQYPDRMPFPQPTHGEAIIGFNDHPKTTEQDIYTVLDKAAMRLEEMVL